MKPKRKGSRPPKLLAVVSQDMCTGCEVCIAGCPVDCIELVSGSNLENPWIGQVVEVDLSRCIGCQNCSEDCPWHVITMYKAQDAFIAWGRETVRSHLYLEESEPL